MKKRTIVSLVALGLASLSLSACGLVGNNQKETVETQIDEDRDGSIELVVTSEPNGWTVDTSEGPQSLDTVGRNIADEALENTGTPLRDVDLGVYLIEGVSSTDESSTYVIEDLENKLLVSETKALDGYNIEMVTGGITNSDGKVYFDNLPPGVYYISQSDGETDEMYPFIVSIPTYNEDAGVWSYDLFIKR